MKTETRKLLEKASHAISAAELLLKESVPDFAASRAYYAMFYIAEALLGEKGLRYSKHSGVHAAYGEHFAKTKELDPKFHRWLIDAFDKRLEGDYGFDYSLKKEDVVKILEQAHEFLRAAQQYLQTDE